MYHYTSDATAFMKKFLEKNPKVAESRLTHRDKLWDVTLNSEELAEFKLGSVAKRPYTYYPNPEPKLDPADDR